MFIPGMRPVRAFLLCAWVMLLAAPGAASAQLLYAITHDNHLELFEASAPGIVLSRVAITGLLPNTELLAIDMRPRDRQLYALGAVAVSPTMAEGRLYRVHPGSGRARFINAVPFELPASGEFGFDFNPVTDQIRVVSRTKGNFRLDPSSGGMIDGDPVMDGRQPDTPLSVEGIVAAAHGFNYHGAQSTTLFGLDTQANRLVTIGGRAGNPSPNLGAVMPIGELNVGVPTVVGLDAGLPPEQLFASLQTRDQEDAYLVRIDPETGRETEIGLFGRAGGPETAVRDIAVVSFPITAYAVTASGRLLRFQSHRPTDIIKNVAITGLAAGEAIVAIDMEPRGQLLGVSNQGRVYNINKDDGISTPWTLNAPLGLTGSNVGMAWEYETGTMRLVDDSGRHVTVNQTVTPRTALSRAGVVAIGASSPAAGAPTLYGIDAANDVLVRIGGPRGSSSPDGGEVTTIGPLGVDVNASAGFDIDPASNIGFLVRHLVRPGDTPLDLLYAVDLVTGTARLLGTIPSPQDAIVALALATPGDVRLTLGSPTLLNESVGKLKVDAIRYGGGVEPFAVEYGTGPGTAQAGTDYTPVSGTFVFYEGEQNKSFEIPITNDTEVEFDFESFTVFLAHPTSGVISGFAEPITVFIQDDESPPNAPPSISIAQPTTGGTYEARSSFITISGTASDDRNVVAVTWSDSQGRRGTAQGTTQWTIPALALEAGTTTIRVRATDVLGERATATLTVTRATTFTALLAEGATGDFFDLDILLANPEGVPVQSELVFLKDDGSTVTHARTLPPFSRTTVRVDEIAGMERAAASTIVTSTHPVIVERTMRWADGAGYGAHTEKAVEGAAAKWYFAEGAQGFFSTYLLLTNPNATASTATIEYLREGAAPLTRTYPLAPQSRFTVDTSDDSELVDQSFGMIVTFDQPGVAERAMYFGTEPLWKAGHESAGVTAPSPTWFLAEGATGPFFETFILLANPQAAPAEVTATYLLQGGAPIEKRHTVPASGRLTINIEAEDPALANAAVGTRIESSLPIVVERAQYWPNSPDQWYEAHNSFGVTETARDWALAEGRVGGAGQYETFILLANPGAEEASVAITFLRTSGAPFTRTFTVPAASRLNVSTGANGPVPELVDEEFSAVIASTQPIAVERALYSTVGGLVWSAGTNATATRFKPIE